MPVSRREFTHTFFAGAGTLGLPLRQRSNASFTSEEVLALLDGQAGASIFDDGEWLELLRRALELNAETRAVLRGYELSADIEPTITFVRY